jgi:magnesium transporter
MIVDRAIYRDGRLTTEPRELGHSDDAFRAGGGLAWVGLYRPTEQEFAAVAAEFGLHELAIEDAVHPHQGGVPLSG